MKVAVVGVGLIGGSVALDLKEKDFTDRIVGVDKNDLNLAKALKMGVIDETASLEEAISKCDIILLTVPVDGILDLLPKVLDLVSNQVVIEMGSTKKMILDRVDQHPNRGRLVASHPMAGTEYSGPEAALPGLFRGKILVYTEITRSDDDAFEVAEQLAEALEMTPTYMNAEEHDIHTAYISHISHLTSMALALTVLEKEKSHGRIFELAGSGFESTVRLAKSSPDMWTPIFQQNRTHVLEVLEEHIKQLHQLHVHLEDENYAALHRLIKKSNKIRRILK